MKQVRSHFQIIRDAASKAESGTSEDVSSYASAVTYPFIRPGPIKVLVDRRIAELQLRYKANSLPPVSEETLVQALNRLGDKLGLPDYGKTNSLEFRLFKISTLRNMPELNLVDADGRSGKLSSTSMAPAEMAYLVCWLVLQKRINPSFQLTEAELLGKYRAYRANHGSDLATRSTGPPMIRDPKSLFPYADPSRGRAINLALSTFDATAGNITEFETVFSSFLAEIGYGR